MKTPDMPEKGQAERLLEVIETQRAEACAELLGAARDEARRMVRQAFRGARRRLAEGVRDQRLRSRERVDAALARLNTVRRARDRERIGGLLAEAWEHMSDALARRWREPQARRAWCDGLIEQARAALPATRAWRIHHPAAWDEAERERIAAGLAEAGLPVPLFVEDETVTAGLRIETDGALLDGTAAGLLNDRTAVEALLLSELEGG